MSTTVLVLNAGSSSLKYQLIDVDAGRSVAGGIVERIGEERAAVEHRWGDRIVERDGAIADHHQAMATVIDLFGEIGPSLADAGIVAVGHRTVMGGREIDGPVLVDDAVLAAIEALSPLAPLHNPANLAALQVARELLPDLPHVAVFDTAFFHGLPEVAATYALDDGVAREHGILRYGFHGTSHEYVSATAIAELGLEPDGVRQVVLHLGNGASASAVVGHRPVDTSMGMTPLEGLVMGTRTGDIDAGVIFHLVRQGMTLDEIDDLLNTRSGMRGLTGASDMREVHRLIAAGNPHARLGLDVYVHRLRKYIGAYAAVMGGLDVITFTAGVGENDPVTRAEVADGLSFLGVFVDPARNEAPQRGARVISPDGAPVAVLVVPTAEELAIARKTVALLG